MRNYIIGEIEDKIIFTQLPEVKDPIVKGLDKDSELVACFLSEWNSIESADDLLEYLYMMKNQDDSHDEFEDILRFGLYNEFEHSSLLFAEDGISITSGKNISTGTILFSAIISIVENWKLYMTIIRNEDVIFYGGQFFFETIQKSVSTNIIN